MILVTAWPKGIQGETESRSRSPLASLVQPVNPFATRHDSSISPAGRDLLLHTPTLCFHVRTREIFACIHFSSSGAEGFPQPGAAAQAAASQQLFCLLGRKLPGKFFPSGPNCSLTPPTPEPSVPASGMLAAIQESYNLFGNKHRGQRATGSNWLPALGIGPSGLATAKTELQRNGQWRGEGGRRAWKCYHLGFGKKSHSRSGNTSGSSRSWHPTCILLCSSLGLGSPLFGGKCQLFLQQEKAQWRSSTPLWVSICRLEPHILWVIRKSPPVTLGRVEHLEAGAVAP